MIQTWAMIVDAYRELNARKLFWVTLGLSILFAGVLGCLGINEKGFTIFWWVIPTQVFNTSFVEKSAFYRWIFEGVGFSFWLSWAASIIAIISTASIVPDFVSSGSIELTLSKPISRVRLFLLKYFSGLLFVTLQVAVFTLLAFTIVGVRGGEWVWAFFWAIPLTVLFFSYLYSISALVGMLTRSGITSILVTGLIWLVIWAAHTAETVLLQVKIQYELATSVYQTELTTRRDQIAELEKKVAIAEAAQPAPEEKPAEKPPEKPADKPADPAAEPAPWPTMDELARAKTTQRDALDKQKNELVDREARSKEAESMLQNLRYYHGIVFGVMTALPKTAETMSILEHRLVSTEEKDGIQKALRGGRAPDKIPIAGVQVSIRTMEAEKEKVVRARSIGWVLGTSLAFEALLLSIASWLFSRRDF